MTFLSGHHAKVSIKFLFVVWALPGCRPCSWLKMNKYFMKAASGKRSMALDRDLAKSRNSRRFKTKNFILDLSVNGMLPRHLTTVLDNN